MTTQRLMQAISAKPAHTSPVDQLVALYRSEAFRQSVRVALAMVLAYYISLAMGWEKPHWAGLAVALCSLGTVGGSINKGLLRILGTALAGAVAIALLILFPQDRWTYLVVATLFVGYSAYMMGHSSRWYLWSIAGYVMALLALAGGPDGATTFETVVLRIQQTAMGVVVYSLVAALLWPRPAIEPLMQRVHGLVDVQRRLIAHDAAILMHTRSDVDAPALRMQATRGTAQLPADIDAAELDSFEVWETRRQWRRCVADLGALNEALERWRHGFPELGQLDLERLMPHLATLAAELDARLAEVGRMLGGEAPRRGPQEVAARLDEEALAAMTPFDCAALVCSQDQLHRIERLTRALFDTVADIRGFGEPTRQGHAERRSAALWTLDPDRLTAAVRAFVAVWLVLLACIYIPSFPMPAGVIPVTAALVIQLAIVPQLSTGLLVAPALGGIVVAGVFSIFVMPPLSSFLGLGVAIFIAVFLLCYLFSKPSQDLARSLVLAQFVMVILVSNEQTYDFLYIANTAQMWLFGIGAVWISGWFPISFQPQQVVFKQLHRFLRSADRLMGAVRGEPGHWPQRMALAFHKHEVTTLPGKLDRWLAALPAVADGGVPREQVQALADSLHALSGRVRELLEVRGVAQSPAIVRELIADMRAWRLGIQDVLVALAADPAGVEAGRLRTQLDAKLQTIEARMETALDTATKDEASTEELDNMYRMLGAYRGVSEALVSFASQAGAIDWPRVREARF